MDHAQDQQQKDFMSSFFPAEHTLQGSGSAAQHSQQQAMFPFNQTSPGAQSSAGMQPFIPPHGRSQINMDLLGSLMQMQGIDSPSSATMSPQTSSYNPQLMLEQQFKLSQLQQLQQLQNQIFQQQASIIIFFDHRVPGSPRSSTPTLAALQNPPSVPF